MWINWRCSAWNIPYQLTIVHWFGKSFWVRVLNYVLAKPVWIVGDYGWDLHYLCTLLSSTNGLLYSIITVQLHIEECVYVVIVITLLPVTIGVVPPHKDEETISFVKTQKLQRLCDLKHTLKVMGKLPSQLYTGYEATQSISPTIQTSSPEDLVSIYLLENNRILSSSMRQEWQVDLTAIAQHFVNLFEIEVEAYWLFSTFAQRWESQLCDIGSLVSGD